MDLMFIIYFIDTFLVGFKTLESFIVVLFAGSCIAGLFGPLIFAAASGYGKEGDALKKGFDFVKKSAFSKISICLLSVFIIIQFIPTKETAYKMLAVYGAKELSDTKEFNEITGKSYKVLNKILDDFLGEEKEEGETK